MTQAPFYPDLAQGPNGAQTNWVMTADGTRLRVTAWPKGQKGTVVIFPGRTEYIEKYGPAAVEFAKAGFATTAIDWRGQGIADRAITNRKIGHTVDFKRFQQDVAAYMAHLETLDLPKPFYLLGHSMGGCIGLRALYDKLNVEKAIFSAPMWGIILNPVMRAAAWSISALLNPTPLRDMLSPGADKHSLFETGPFEGNKLTTDLEMYKFMEHHIQTLPDLALGGPSVAWLHGALREMRALSKMPSPDLPCLTFLGTNERIVDPARIHDRMGRWPNGTLEIVKGAEHEIMLEASEMRQGFYEKSIEFINA